MKAFKDGHYRAILSSLSVCNSFESYSNKTWKNSNRIQSIKCINKQREKIIQCATTPRKTIFPYIEKGAYTDEEVADEKSLCSSCAKFQKNFHANWVKNDWILVCNFSNKQNLNNVWKNHKCFRPRKLYFVEKTTTKQTNFEAEHPDFKSVEIHNFWPLSISICCHDYAKWIYPRRFFSIKVHLPDIKLINFKKVQNG